MFCQLFECESLPREDNVDCQGLGGQNKEFMQDYLELDVVSVGWL